MHNSDTVLSCGKINETKLQSLVEELVNCGVIRSFPKVKMEDFLGYAALVNPMSRKWKRDSFASLGDIRSVLIEHCILPMGNESPESAKTFLSSDKEAFLVYSAILNRTLSLFI